MCLRYLDINKRGYVYYCSYILCAIVLYDFIVLKIFRQYQLSFCDYTGHYTSPPKNHPPHNHWNYFYDLHSSYFHLEVIGGVYPEVQVSYSFSVSVFSLSTYLNASQMVSWDIVSTSILLEHLLFLYIWVACTCRECNLCKYVPQTGCQITPTILVETELLLYSST